MTPTEFAEALEARLEDEYTRTMAWAAGVEYPDDIMDYVDACRSRFAVVIEVKPRRLRYDTGYGCLVGGHYVETDESPLISLAGAVAKWRQVSKLNVRDTGAKVCGNCKHAGEGWGSDYACWVLGFEIGVEPVHTCDRWEGEP